MNVEINGNWRTFFEQKIENSYKIYEKTSVTQEVLSKFYSPAPSPHTPLYFPDLGIINGEIKLAV